jgi:alpha-N-arabinofuranosidase
MSEVAQTISESQSTSSGSIKVDVDRVVASIDEKIYSGFTEHMGRCIYGGLIDLSPDASKLVNAKGYRLDVADALRNLDMPVVRYPGGNFVSSYHWQDGIGPKESRPRRPELAWRGEESNLFGTDEFMDWCQFMSVEPYLCLNMGTGTLDEALAWLEYCNSDSNTYYANLRRKNGHEKAYKVKYWSLGNEVYGPWQVGQQTAEDYTKKAFQWAKALKILDPSIKLVACGCTGLDKWDLTVTQGLISQVDYYSIHLYTSDPAYYKNITAPIAAERAIQITSRLLDLARITENAYDNNVKICFDEWNVWDPKRADGELGAEQKYTLSDALAVASWLNLFVRQAHHVGMANIAQCVNVIAPIMTSTKGLFLQTIYHPFELFSNHMRGNSINLHIETPYYRGSAGSSTWKTEWISDIESQIPMLDVSATIKDGTLTIAVVNRSLEEDVTTKFMLAQKLRSTVRTWTLYHEDISATNSFENPNNVQPVEKSHHNDVLAAGYKFSKHSFTVLQVEVHAA